MRRKIPLAWLQLKREKIRLAVALSGISFAVVLVFMQYGFQDSLYDSNTTPHQHLKGEIVLMHPQTRGLPALQHFPRARLHQARAVTGVTSVHPLYIDFAEWKTSDTRQKYSIFVFGFDPAKPVFDLPEVTQNLSKIQQMDTVLFDRASLPEFGPIPTLIEQGQPVVREVEDRQIKVKGLFTIGTSFATDGTLITSDLNFMRLKPHRRLDEVDLGIVSLQPDVDPQVVKSSLQAKFGEEVKVMTRQEFIDLEIKYWSDGTAVGFIFGLGVFMGLFVGTVVVYQILYSDVSDHLAEYATLKAVGFSDRYLLNVVFKEALILAVLGYMPGFAIATILYKLTHAATQLQISMTIVRALWVLILTIGMCLSSGGIAVRRLHSADPADIF
ncbi:MAG: ABC transporter permease DevC [Leptolyngbyaceae cyanobacterium MO_188.B28]|nr:ABC transporter permease DevC [Leptolyngbyaceae cyanobacterium MO_188.B28]